MAVKTDYTAEGGQQQENGRWEWRNQLGQLHREDGPAVIYPGGPKNWYLNGQTHRADGPAVRWSNGHSEHWLHGQHINREVADWMRSRGMELPLTPEQEMEFCLRWC
jgi:hypothetical protein